MFDDKKITEMLSRTEKVQPQTDCAPAKAVPVIKKHYPVKWIAAIAAASIICVCAIAAFNLNNNVIGGASQDNESAQSIDASQDNEPDVSDAPDDPIRPSVAPWTDGRLTLTSVTYDDAQPSFTASVARAYTRLLDSSEPKVKNVTVSSIADTKLAPSTDPRLLDITYTVQGEHADCFGVYIDLDTGDTICLQELFFDALGEGKLIEIFKSNAREYLSGAGSTKVDAIDYAKLYHGGYTTLSEIGIGESADMTAEIYGNIAKIKSNTHINVLEYGTNRDYAIVQLASHPSLLFNLKETDFTNNYGTYLFDIKNGTATALDIYSYVGGQASSVRATSDYRYIVYGETNYETGNEIPTVLDTETLARREISSGDDACGLIYISHTERYAYYKTANELYNSYMSQIQATCPYCTVFYGFNTQKTTRIYGDLLGLICNDGIAVMKINGGIYYYDLASGEQVGELPEALEYERYSRFEIDTHLYAVDIITGDRMLIAENVKAYVAVANGAYVYTLSVGDDRIICHDRTTGEKGEVLLPAEFVTASNGRTVEILSNKDGDVLTVCHYGDSIFTLADDSAFYDIADYFVNKDDASVESYAFFTTFNYRLWNVQGTVVTGDTLTKLSRIAGELLRDSYISALGDGKIDIGEINDMIPEYTSLIGEYISVNGGCVRVIDSRYIDLCGGGYLNANKYFRELDVIVSGGTVTREIGIDVLALDIIAELAKPLGLDYQAAADRLIESVTSNHAFTKDDYGNIKVIIYQNSEIYDIKQLTFKLCIAMYQSGGKAITKNNINALYIDFLQSGKSLDGLYINDDSGILEAIKDLEFEQASAYSGTCEYGGWYYSIGTSEMAAAGDMLPLDDVFVVKDGDGYYLYIGDCRAAIDTEFLERINGAKHSAEG